MFIMVTWSSSTQIFQQALFCEISGLLWDVEYLCQFCFTSRNKLTYFEYSFQINDKASLGTKLEILNDEFKTKRQRNPIDSIRSRIKSPLSIYEKLKRRNYPVSIQSIADNLNDVAGIRVVCPFISDIYDVARMLISQDDVEVMEVKDYIKNPKPNGYRSLHYVVIIPIFLSSGKEYMKVEVQIRTIAMNFWASLEHQMHYKQFDNDDMPEIVKQLTECAENIYQTDVRMQEIREDIHKFNE